MAECHANWESTKQRWNSQLESENCVTPRRSWQFKGQRAKGTGKGDWHDWKGIYPPDTINQFTKLVIDLEYNFNKGDTKMDFCWKGSKHSTIFEIHLCTLTCKLANNLLTCFDCNGNFFKDAFKLIGWELFEILWTISRKVTTGIYMYIHVCTYDDTPPHSFHIVTVSAGWDPGPAIRDLGSWISNLESRRFRFRFVLGTSGYNEN